VLARWNGEPVLVRQGRVFAATFHPELTDDRRIHELVVGQESEIRHQTSGKSRQ
jgi:5'-phosphate synthase pdxT subunit